MGVSEKKNVKRAQSNAFYDKYLKSVSNERSEGIGRGMLMKSQLWDDRPIKSLSGVINLLLTARWIGKMYERGEKGGENMHIYPYLSVPRGEISSICVSVLNFERSVASTDLLTHRCTRPGIGSDWWTVSSCSLLYILHSVWSPLWQFLTIVTWSRKGHRQKIMFECNMIKTIPACEM